jgi:hypothetical protein
MALRLRDAGLDELISDRLGVLTRTNSESLAGAMTRSVTPPEDFSQGVAITSSMHPEPNTHFEVCHHGKGYNSMYLMYGPMIARDLQEGRRGFAVLASTDAAAGARIRALFEDTPLYLEAGSDVLLEKPPVVSTAQHDALMAACRRHNRVCQVGFQNMAGAPMQRLLELISAGRLGTVRDIVVTGAWIRRDGYYARSPWAGRRMLDEMVVADGAATNPFAHAVMNALAIAGAVDPDGTPVGLDVESYRCRNIATDDTVSALVRIAQMHGSSVRVNSIFGEGVSPRLRKVRLGLAALGWPPNDLLKHGRERILYGVPLVENLLEFSLGIDARPKYFVDPKLNDTDDSVAVWWLDRWATRRAAQQTVQESMRTHRLVRPVRHGARVPSPADDELPLDDYESAAASF